MTGITLASGIEGSLDAQDIVLGLLKSAFELTDLKPFVEGPLMIPNLVSTIPIEITPPEACEDLDEWEMSEISGSTFDAVKFNLKKDRVKLGVSDEARFRSRAGDPMAIQKASGTDRLATLLNRKIVRALNTSPQSTPTGFVGKWKTADDSNPLLDLNLMAAAIRPYQARRILMGTTAYAYYASHPVVQKFGVGNISQYEKAAAVLPGLNIPIYSSMEVDSIVAAKAVFVAGANAAVLGNGPVMIREEDVMAGGHIYQVDVWRQVIGGYLNDGTYAKTVCKAADAVSSE